MPEFRPTTQVFNTPLECGLRSACLLMAAYPAGFDLQRLVQYDYLVVHSGDVDNGPASIHPATPHRSGELLVRRAVVESGLEFMKAKGIIAKVYTASGISYVAGEYAAMFLGALEAAYVGKLRDRSEWVVATFRDLTDDRLAAYMRGRWSLWGSEFIRESLFEMSE
jgi:hypothetical protein